MNFNPQQVDVFADAPIKRDIKELIDPGIYPFRIVNAIDHVSKEGNPSIRLTVVYTLDDRSTAVVIDYLSPNALGRIKNFCAVANLMDKFDSGSLLPEDCIGCEGLVDITISKAKDKGNGEFFPEKNSVKFYLNKNMEPKAKTVDSKKSEELIDDDIPF